MKIFKTSLGDTFQSHGFHHLALGPQGDHIIPTTKSELQQTAVLSGTLSITTMLLS